MTDKYILDENGKPAPEPDIVKWGTWYKENERHAAEDQIGEVRVSTVFLGLDHSHDGVVPVLWETMIFGGEHNLYQDRYSTKEEAIKGHARAIRLVKRSVTK